MWKKRKISFDKYFRTFLIVSILETFYEVIVYVIEYFIDNGRFGWSRRSGVFFGPISPVYGFGAVFMLFFLGKREEKWWKVLLKAAILGGVAEFALSYIQELVTGRGHGIIAIKCSTSTGERRFLTCSSRASQDYFSSNGSIRLCINS